MPFLGAEHSNEADALLTSKALKANKKMAQQNRDLAEEMSGSSRLTIAPSPARLTCLFPPPNYGTVEKGTVFRSGFPQPRHLEFMASLEIRSILYVQVIEARVLISLLTLFQLPGRHGTEPRVP